MKPTIDTTGKGMTQILNDCRIIDTKTVRACLKEETQMTTTMLSKGIIEAHPDPKRKVVIFDMSLGRIPPEYVAQAKQIDGEAYTESCFAFQLKFLIDANRFIIAGKDGREMYYMDENGDKHHMDVKLQKNVYDLAVEQCNAYLKKTGIKRERKRRVSLSAKKQTQVMNNMICCVYDPDIFIGRRKKYVGSGQLALF